MIKTQIEQTHSSDEQPLQQEDTASTTGESESRRARISYAPDGRPLGVAMFFGAADLHALGIIGDPDAATETSRPRAVEYHTRGGEVKITPAKADREVSV